MVLCCLLLLRTGATLPCASPRVGQLRSVLYRRFWGRRSGSTSTCRSQLVTTRQQSPGYGGLVRRRSETIRAAARQPQRYRWRHSLATLIPTRTPLHTMYRSESNSEDSIKCSLPNPLPNCQASPDIHTLDSNNRSLVTACLQSFLRSGSRVMG
jgi:hypothetical protein